MSSPLIKPLAIALVGHSRSAAELVRSQARVAVAAYARSEGFALAETFDLVGDERDDRATLAALAALVAEREVTVILTSGRVDVPQVQRACGQTPVRSVSGIDGP